MCIRERHFALPKLARPGSGKMGKANPIDHAGNGSAVNMAQRQLLGQGQIVGHAQGRDQSQRLEHQPDGAAVQGGEGRRG